MRKVLPAAFLAAGLLSSCSDSYLPPAGRFVPQGPGGRMVSTDCLGRGEPDARGSWPDDDATRFRFLPPGCAAATGIAQMVVDPDDLVRGRPLAPGAALPVARAIERYYNGAGDTQASGSGGGASATVPGAEPGLTPGSTTSGPTPGVTPGPGDASASAASQGRDGAAGLLQGPLSN